jgi:hypothetical protein
VTCIVGVTNIHLAARLVRFASGLVVGVCVEVMASSIRSVVYDINNEDLLESCIVNSHRDEALFKRPLHGNRAWNELFTTGY